MKSRIAIAVSALALGTALAVTPSFAQTSSQPNGQPGETGAQQGSSGCIVFQQGCSNKPYPMNNNEQTGTGQSGTARSASGSERPTGERLSSESRAAPNREPVAGQQATQERERAGGEAYRLGPNRTYAYAPGPEYGPAASGAIQWCETRFRSFDPATGTYMGFDGIRHACP
jgi:hypothetical protein